MRVIIIAAAVAVACCWVCLEDDGDLVHGGCRMFASVHMLPEGPAAPLGAARARAKTAPGAARPE